MDSNENENEKNVNEIVIELKNVENIIRKCKSLNKKLKKRKWKKKYANKFENLFEWDQVEAIQMFEEKKIYIIISMILVFEKILLVKLIELLIANFWKIPLKFDLYKICENYHFEKGLKFFFSKFWNLIQFSSRWKKNLNL